MLVLEVIWEWNTSFLRLILHGTKKDVHHEDSDFCCDFFCFSETDCIIRKNGIDRKNPQISYIAKFILIFHRKVSYEISAHM